MDQISRKRDAGRHSEFVELLTRNYYKLNSFILTLVPHRTDAEDVLQSSITYMWEHFKDFKPDSNFLSWAFTICKYQVLTYYKQQQRCRLQFSPKAIDIIEAENEKVSDALEQRYDALKACMKHLSEKDLTFLKRRYVESKSLKSLADEIGMSINVAYKHLVRIKNALLRCVHQKLDSGDVI